MSATANAGIDYFSPSVIELLSAPIQKFAALMGILQKLNLVAGDFLLPRLIERLDLDKRRTRVW
jgi:hypothetical protein